MTSGEHACKPLTDSLKFDGIGRGNNDRFHITILFYTENRDETTVNLICKMYIIGMHQYRTMTTTHDDHVIISRGRELESQLSSMSRHDIRFMIYLGVTIAALILMVVGGICYRVNSWLLVGLMMISMLPLLWFVLSPYFTPRWVKQVQASGVRAAAEVLSGCGLESIGSRGSDMWLEVPVQVHPQNGEPFRAR